MANGDRIEMEELERIREWRKAMVAELGPDWQCILAACYPHRECLYAMLRVMYALPNHTLLQMAARIWWMDADARVRSLVPASEPPHSQEEHPCPKTQDL